MAHRCAGSGPDVVLLHGLLGSRRQWDDAVAELAPRHRCWALALPGISDSPRRRDQSLPGLCAWLAESVDQLGLREFALVGSSWGGLLALAFACAPAQRGRAQRVVLVAPAHPYWTPSRRQRWLMTPAGTRLGAFLGARLAPPAHRALLGTMYADPRRVREASVLEYGRTLRLRGLGAALAATTRGWRRDQAWLRPQLGRLAAPTLLVWGARDTVVPAATAPALRAALPAAQLVVLPGLGHLPFAEDAPAFAAAVEPFLSAA